MSLYGGMNYQYPQYAQQYAQPMQDERIWVQNEASAEAYLVAPNGFVRLWDSNKNRFYEKRADASGRMMPLEAYEYSRISLTERRNDDEGINHYQEQIDAILGRIEALERERRNDKKSDADDTAIQSIQGSL